MNVKTIRFRSVLKLDEFKTIDEAIYSNNNDDYHYIVASIYLLLL